MNNQEVRQAAKAAGVKLWQVAESLGLSDTAFSRRLRHELPEKTRRQALAVIEKLAQEAE